MSLIADGSSKLDAPDRVEIDPDQPTTKWMFRCPNGHSSFEPTNGGIWCRSCSRSHDIDDPHHHEIRDLQNDRLIPWSRVIWGGSR